MSRPSSPYESSGLSDGSTGGRSSIGVEAESDTERHVQLTLTRQDGLRLLQNIWRGVHIGFAIPESSKSEVSKSVQKLLALNAFHGDPLTTSESGPHLETGEIVRELSNLSGIIDQLDHSQCISEGTCGMIRDNMEVLRSIASHPVTRVPDVIRNSAAAYEDLFQVYAAAKGMVDAPQLPTHWDDTDDAPDSPIRSPSPSLAGSASVDAASE